MQLDLEDTVQSARRNMKSVELNSREQPHRQQADNAGCHEQ